MSLAVKPQVKLFLQFIAHTAGLTLHHLIDWLDRVLPPTKPTLAAAAPTPRYADLTPDQAEAIAVAEAVAQFQLQAEVYVDVSLFEPVEVPEVIELPAAPETPEVLEIPELTSPEPAPLTPAMSRGELVQGLLDEAWMQGLRTYAQLINYVELQTGKGCSKKAIAAWKKARNLTASEPTAA